MTDTNLYPVKIKIPLSDATAEIALRYKKKPSFKIDKPVYAIHLAEVERWSDCFNCAFIKKCNSEKKHGKYCIAWTQG